MTDVWLKITGTKRQVRDALKTLGFEKEMLRRNEAGKLELAGYNHHIAMEFIRNRLVQLPVTSTDADGNTTLVSPPVFDGPHLMIRFVSERARAKVRRKLVRYAADNPDGTRGARTRFPLPPGLAHADDPSTVVWA